MTTLRTRTDADDGASTGDDAAPATDRRPPPADVGADHGASTGEDPAPILERSLGLHPHVALRPEPFGALAYHYDTRRLVFLKHPDIVRVVRGLADHRTVADTLRGCGIAGARVPAFVRALTDLLDAEMLHDCAR